MSAMRSTISVKRSIGALFRWAVWVGSVVLLTSIAGAVLSPFTMVGALYMTGNVRGPERWAWLMLATAATALGVWFVAYAWTGESTPQVWMLPAGASLIVALFGVRLAHRRPERADIV